MASPTYRYSALQSSRHIRLAKITHQDKQNLHVTVESFNLDTAPAFEALSYTWGPATRENEHVNCLSPTPTALHQIHMDDCPFSVTENLHDALCELSNRETAQFMWIDALCIDQSNFLERPSQVLLMGDIYASAQRVIVWLGKDVTDLEDFLWIHDVCTSYLDSLPECPTPFDVDMLQQLGVSEERWLRYWESYHRFYQRHSWFYRLWVVQEFALPREVTLRCAYATLDWPKMGVMTFLLSHQWSILRYSKVNQSLWAMNNTTTLMISLRTFTQDNHGFDNGSSMCLNLAGISGVQTPEELWYAFINFLIQAIRGREASDPRDMIYGTLGIAQRFLPAGVRNSILPDYLKSVEEIYMSISRLLLENIPTLVLLSYLDYQGSRNFASLPSWCPDFSRPKLTAELISQGTDAQGYRLFNASRIELGALRGAFRPPCQVLNSTLLVSGKRIDTVEEVCLPLEEIIPSKGLQHIFRLALSLDHFYPLTNQDRVEVLWRTMIINTSGGGLDGQSYPAEPIYSEYFINTIGMLSAIELQSLPQEERGPFLELYENFRSSLVAPPLAEKLMGVTFVNSNLTDLPNDSNNASHAEREWDKTSVLSDKFVLQVSRTSANRSLIRTSRNLLGLAPVYTQPGDEIWILERALVPFILRRCPGKEEYTVVGETYVHGVMNGEAFEMTDWEESFTTISIV